MVRKYCFLRLDRPGFPEPTVSDGIGPFLKQGRVVFSAGIYFVWFPRRSAAPRGDRPGCIAGCLPKPPEKTGGEGCATQLCRGLSLFLAPGGEVPGAWPSAASMALRLWRKFSQPRSRLLQCFPNLATLGMRVPRSVFLPVPPPYCQFSQVSHPVCSHPILLCVCWRPRGARFDSAAWSSARCGEAAFNNLPAADKNNKQ